MRIIVLLENTAADPGLICRHGLSMLLESKGTRFLFDSGPDDSFLKNAEAMGVDLSDISFAVLSHGHYDHGGGLPFLVHLFPDLPVFLRGTAFGDQRNVSGKYIGLDESLASHSSLVFTDGTKEIAPRIRVFGDVSERMLIPPISNSLLSGGKPDPFTHEQNLLIEEDGRLFLIGGCAHCGIVNIVEKAKAVAGRYPDFVLSGMHLSVHGRTSDDVYLGILAKKLQSLPSRFYTFHCTGLEPFEKLKAILGDQIHYLPGGTTITL